MTGFTKEKESVFRFGFHNEFALGLGNPVSMQNNNQFDELAF